MIIDIEQGKETERYEIDLAGLGPQGKVQRLKDAEVNAMICAGLSLSLQRMLALAGLKIIPGIVGSADEVLNAYRKGNLKDRRFMMPGFCQRRRKRGHWHGHRCNNNRPEFSGTFMMNIQKGEGCEDPNN